MTRFSRPAALAALLPLLAACDGPTEAIREPLVFSGELARQGSVRHDLPVTDDGLVEIELLELLGRDIETDEVTDLTIALLFELGRPGVDDEGEPACAATDLTSISETTSLVYNLVAGDYCVELSDAAVIPEGQVALYTLRISATE